MLTITIGRENTAYPSISDQYDAEISEAVQSGKTKLFLAVHPVRTKSVERPHFHNELDTLGIPKGDAWHFKN